MAVLVALYNEFNDKMKQRTLQCARGRCWTPSATGMATRGAAPPMRRLCSAFQWRWPSRRTSSSMPGTRITTDGSVYFATDPRSPSCRRASCPSMCQATCTEGGTAYNGFTTGTINTLVDLIPYISSAVNITDSVGGDDGEPYTEAGDEKFRERIRLAPATLSTAGPESGYRYFALAADPRIVDVAIDNPSANVIKIYPLLADGELPDEEILQKVEASCSGEKVRPMTDQVEALAPAAVQYDIEIKYYCTQDNEADTVKAVEARRPELLNATTTGRPAHWIGTSTPTSCGGLFCPRTGRAALWALTRVDVVKPVFTEIGKHQVAKFSGSLTVTHEVVI